MIRSESSISFCFIFLTISASLASGTYLRFEDGVSEVSACPGVVGRAAPFEGGVPGVVVDSARFEMFSTTEGQECTKAAHKRAVLFGRGD